MSGITTDYSRFYKGTQQLQTYGSGVEQKDTLVRYEFNTTDENGNKVMDKMSREETIQAMNSITAQYGDNVIVSFSGDGLAALAESVEKKGIDEARILKEHVFTEEEIAEKEARERELEISRQKSKEEGEARQKYLASMGVRHNDSASIMKSVDPEAYKQYQKMFETGENHGLFLARWMNQYENGKTQSSPKADSNIIDDLSSRFSNAVFSVSDGKDNSSKEKEFSVILSTDEMNILKHGSEEEKNKLYSLIEDSLKKISDAVSGASDKDLLNRFMVGVNIEGSNLLNFFAQGEDKTYSASTMDELIKAITEVK
ncbi:MAG: hypothetical protein IKO16_04610 [Lachnospiraceae bacterium]|nr:hypothetical protein [Lachnospiraceae bacterium]